MAYPIPMNEHIFNKVFDSLSANTHYNAKDRHKIAIAVTDAIMSTNPMEEKAIKVNLQFIAESLQKAL